MSDRLEEIQTLLLDPECSLTWDERQACSRLLTELSAARARNTQLEAAGRAFLDAYVNASVSDEEGLLASTDEREWRALWQRCDEAAQSFGAALSSPETVQ